MSRLNRIRSAVKPIAGTIKEAHVLTYAAAADYHVFIALAPALMLLVSLIRFLPVTQEEVLKVFSDTISDQAFSFIDSLASSVFNSNETTTVISSLLLLVSASGAIRSLMKGLDEVYGTKRKEPFLIFAGRAMVYTLLFLVMIVVSLILLVYGSGLLAYVLSISPEHSFLEKAIPFLQDTRYFLWGLILIPIFMFLYHRLPSGKRKFRSQFPGAVFSAVSWAVFSWGYSIYVCDGLSIDYNDYINIDQLFSKEEWKTYSDEFRTWNEIFSYQLGDHVRRSPSCCFFSAALRIIRYSFVFVMMPLTSFSLMTMLPSPVDF